MGPGLQGGAAALGLSEVARRVAVVAGAGDEVEVEVEDEGADKLCLSDSVTFFNGYSVSRLGTHVNRLTNQPRGIK